MRGCAGRAADAECSLVSVRCFLDVRENTKRQHRTGQQRKRADEAPPRQGGKNQSGQRADDRRTQVVAQHVHAGCLGAVVLGDGAHPARSEVPRVLFLGICLDFHYFSTGVVFSKFGFDFSRGAVAQTLVEP